MAISYGLVGVLFGLIFGSAINAMVWRLYVGRSWVKGRSECSECGHPLHAKDLVPVVSWLLLGGKCRYCRKPIKDHPVVELVTALVFGLSAYVLAPVSVVAWVGLAFWLVIAVMLIVLAVYDARWKILPNKVMFPCIVVAALAVATRHILMAGKIGWVDLAVVGVGLLVILIDKLDSRDEWPLLYNVLAVVTLLTVGVICYVHGDKAVGGPILAAVGSYAVFFILVVGSKGRGMGGGDIKLAFLMGLILGLQGTVVAMLVAFNAGAIVGVTMIAMRKKGRRDQIPFGPYLVGGTIVAFLFGRQLVAWYLRINGV